MSKPGAQRVRGGLAGPLAFLAISLAAAVIYRLVRAGFAFGDLMRGDGALIRHHVRLPFLAALILAGGMLVLGRLFPMGRLAALIASAVLFAGAYAALLVNTGQFLRHAMTEASLVAVIALITCALLRHGGRGRQAMDQNGQTWRKRRPPPP